MGKVYSLVICLLFASFTGCLGGDDDARKLWKKLKDYHRRSLAETGMYRFKTLFGSDLKSRVFQGQQVEAYVKSKALNIMTNLGMPQSEKIAA